MDQEKFDQQLMDYLFDELDEVSRAAMRRKLDADAGCREIEAGLRATLQVAQLPEEEPSAELEARILEAAERAEAGEPWQQRLWRSLAWAGSHAMRPQFAMAAVLLLVVGSSILLLPVRSGVVGITPDKDDAATSPAASPERALPERALPERALPRRAAARAQSPRKFAEAADSDSALQDGVDPPSPAAAASAEARGKGNKGALAAAELQYKRGMANYEAGRHAEAQRDFAGVVGSKSPRAASAALFQARAVRASSGCKVAIRHYDQVRQQFGGSPVTADATWEQADCHRIVGQPRQARALWKTLQSNRNYQARAETEIRNQRPAGGTAGGALVTRRKKVASRARPAPKGKKKRPAAAKAAPPQGTDQAIEQKPNDDNANSF